jgi:hypothetical protein
VKFSRIGAKGEFALSSCGKRQLVSLSRAGVAVSGLDMFRNVWRTGPDGQLTLSTNSHTRSGGTMKRIMLSLLALSLVVLGLAGIVPGFLPRVGMQTAVQADTESRFTVDIAMDGRTGRFNRGITYQEAGRGDTFVIFGPIYPAGTLPTGPASNSPDDPGSIGAWTFRTTFSYDGGVSRGSGLEACCGLPPVETPSTVDPRAERKVWGGRSVQTAWPRHRDLPVRRWWNAGGRGPGQSADGCCRRGRWSGCFQRRWR